MSSQLTGNWKAFRKLSKNLGQSRSAIVEGAKLGLRQAALKVEARLVLHVQKQDLPWKPLSPAYKRYKQKKGLSTQILIATSTLLNSITSEVRGGGTSAFVGVLRKTAKKKGQDQVLIGQVMEFGSKKRNIPPRPLFKPTLEESTQEIGDTVAENIKQAIAKLIS